MSRFHSYGFAVMRGNKIRTTLLDDREEHVPTCTPTHTLTIATDGSGRKDGRAGYGVTSRWLAPDEDPSLPIIQPDRTRDGPRREEVLIEHYGPVDIDPSSPIHVDRSERTQPPTTQASSPECM